MPAIARRDLLSRAVLAETHRGAFDKRAVNHVCGCEPWHATLRLNLFKRVRERSRHGSFSLPARLGFGESHGDHHSSGKRHQARGEGHTEGDALIVEEGKCHEASLLCLNCRRFTQREPVLSPLHTEISTARYTHGEGFSREHFVASDAFVFFSRTALTASFAVFGQPNKRGKPHAKSTGDSAEIDERRLAFTPLNERKRRGRAGQSGQRGLHS
ncbi:MAG: hypothetical protein M3463_09095 [Verrucomicrobiota bacterium]|nr:hypothetical protein [Verrucomicrobiota bacterium]